MYNVYTHILVMTDAPYDHRGVAAMRLAPRELS